MIKPVRTKGKENAQRKPVSTETKRHSSELNSTSSYSKKPAKNYPLLLRIMNSVIILPRDIDKVQQYLGSAINRLTLIVIIIIIVRSTIEHKIVIKIK